MVAVNFGAQILAPVLETLRLDLLQKPLLALLGLVDAISARGDDSDKTRCV